MRVLFVKVEVPDPLGSGVTDRRKVYVGNADVGDRVLVRLGGREVGPCYVGEVEATGIIESGEDRLSRRIVGVLRPDVKLGPAGILFGGTYDPTPTDYQRGYADGFEAPIHHDVYDAAKSVIDTFVNRGAVTQADMERLDGALERSERVFACGSQRRR